MTQRDGPIHRNLPTQSPGDRNQSAGLVKRISQWGERTGIREGRLGLGGKTVEASLPHPRQMSPFLHYSNAASTCFIPPPPLTSFCCTMMKRSLQRTLEHWRSWQQQHPCELNLNSGFPPSYGRSMGWVWYPGPGGFSATAGESLASGGQEGDTFSSPLPVYLFHEKNSGSYRVLETSLS